MMNNVESGNPLSRSLVETSRRATSQTAAAGPMPRSARPGLGV